MNSYWPAQVSEWLIHSAVFGAVILVLGCMAVAVRREPLERIRIIQWSLAACLLVPLIQQVPGVPGYSLRLWTRAAHDAAPESAPSVTSIPSGPALPLRGLESPPLAAEFAAPAREATETRTTSAPPTAVANAPVSAAGDVASSGLFVGNWASRPSLLTVLQAVYFALVAYWLARWTIGAVRRGELARRARPADACLQAVLTSIAGPSAQQARLLVSEHVHAPMMWGLWRPTIVIPARMAEPAHAESLRWGLAHEWSHVLQGDFGRHLLAGLTKLVCFYQPAYWWMRRQLTLSQDYLADAFAAQQGESVEDYAAFLVALARADRRPPLAGTLGIGHHRSNLYRRVARLVQAGRPLLPNDRLGSRLAITGLALLVACGLCTVRLSATAVDEPAAEATGGVAADDKAAADAPKAPLPDPITYVGHVVDRDTGKPVSGAKVRVFHSLSRHPKTGRWTSLQITSHVTDEQGEYRFTLPPEEVAEPSLYLEVDVHHEKYQSKGRSGYSHAMIRKNLENGEPPFYSKIKLIPGEAITGVLRQPDGSPAAHTRILVYSKAPSKEPGLTFELGAFQEGETDDKGQFRFVVATPGDGVLWAFPKNYSPIAYRLRDRRGDLGELTLAEGTRLSGRVLDAKGRPLAKVAVNLRRQGDGDEIDEFLGANAVANAIGTGAMTDQDGRFELKPLPPGTYRTEVESVSEDPSVPNDEMRGYDRRPLDHVFVATKVTIRGGEVAEPLEFRAVPHIILRGRFFDSQGKPRASHEQHVFGRWNGDGFFAISTLPGNDGWFELKLPHGIESVQLNLMTNEHGSLRWRKKPDEPLTYGRTITWDKLEEDFTTVEIVRYDAPMLLLKAVDENGEPIKDFIPESHYKAKPAVEAGVRFIGGAQGDIRFQEQPDGRWRSSQLLPDEELTVTLIKEGLTCEPQIVSLKEGEVREVVFVLRK